jgi:hypothetical protein
MNTRSKSINERQGLTVIGEQATDLEVERAVDAADGHIDGDVEKAPHDDIQQVIACLKSGDKVSAVLGLASVIAGKGIAPDGTALEWAEMTLLMGESAYGAAVTIAGILGAL